jgi:hypothetical protein
MRDTAFIAGAISAVPVLAAVLSASFAFVGRWIHLHPERTVPKGHFVGPNTLGARLFRIQMAILGTFMVFGGTTGAVFSLLSLLTFGSVRLELSAKLIGVVAGILAAVWVRKEARRRPEYVSNSPYGWWP